MNIKDLVKNNIVKFLYYRKGNLHYEILKREWVNVDSERSNEKREHYVSIFKFPVPIEDTGDASFFAEDKAILYMRYIRKQLAEIAAEKQKSN